MACLRSERKRKLLAQHHPLLAGALSYVSYRAEVPSSEAIRSVPLPAGGGLAHVVFHGP
jgi:hypothetical protein